MSTAKEQTSIRRNWGAVAAGSWRGCRQFILYRAKGCEHCNNTGYKGRLGIHELLMNTATIKHMILAKNNVTEITKVAVGEGMATLRQDGINKILLGLTDWEQIRTI
jgi:type II secretory ATPase GspE/PulE/Tfp pilus assembly ATPase PilB-like protein